VIFPWRGNRVLIGVNSEELFLAWGRGHIRAWVDLFVVLNLISHWVKHMNGWKKSFSKSSCFFFLTISHFLTYLILAKNIIKWINYNHSHFADVQAMAWSVSFFMGLVEALQCSSKMDLITENGGKMETHWSCLLSRHPLSLTIKKK
jgi:hypothetical protein